METKLSHLNSLFLQNTLTRALCHQHTGSSHCLDFLLGPSAEELGLDNHGLLGQLAFAQNFVVTLEEKGRNVKKWTAQPAQQPKTYNSLCTQQDNTLTLLSIGEIITIIYPRRNSRTLLQHLNMYDRR